MVEDQFKNFHSEDIEDFLLQLGKSFDIRFVNSELQYITTLAQLTDHILSKMQVDKSGDCTTQQAFYKLRHSIAETTGLDPSLINTASQLSDILPRGRRRKNVKKIGQDLGSKRSILRPSHFVSASLGLLFLSSFILLFLDWQTGLMIFAANCITFKMIAFFGRELDVKTVGEVAAKMTRESYIKSRRSPTTVNRKEIEEILKYWYREYFMVTPSEEMIRSGIPIT